MEHFMRDGAPPPEVTAAWAHFGCSLACRDPVVRAINSSASMTDLVDRGFTGIEGLRLTGEKAAVGELREVHAAGYANFFGMAGIAQALSHRPRQSAAAVDAGPAGADGQSLRQHPRRGAVVGWSAPESETEKMRTVSRRRELMKRPVVHSGDLKR